MKATLLIDAINFAKRDPLIAQDLKRRDNDDSLVLRGVLSSVIVVREKMLMQVVFDYHYKEAGQNQNKPDLVIDIAFDDNGGLTIVAD